MKTLYLDCGMGAAGDMLTAALLELLPDPEGFIGRMNGLGIPGVRFDAQKTVKCGITGTHVSVTVNGAEEESGDVADGAPESIYGRESACEAEHGHAQEHAHAAEHGHAQEHAHAAERGHAQDHAHAAEHVHGHTHTALHDIEHLVRGHLPLPERVRDDIMAVYGLIAEAESHAHGVPVEEIHFHEVGAMDAVADVTAVCLLMDMLSPDEVVVSPVHVGSGQVRCAHGILPVPAPATAYILKDVPIYGGSVRGELCTPTGAALLKHFATRFGGMPLMRTQAVGYGCGRKDFEAANCVRAMIGVSEDKGDTVLELSCNVDDMTAEEAGFALERLLEGGALEAFTLPAGMKKSRPGILIQALCREQDRDRVVGLLFRHTTTIGIREASVRRYVLDREIKTVDTACGPVRRKDSSGYGVTRSKYEYEDLARIAREKGTGIAEVRRLLEKWERKDGNAGTP